MKTSYLDKLKDPRWQKKRLSVFERDGFKCVICGSEEKTLHVHHCGYSYEFNDPWDYPISWLISLCFECHEHETENLKEAKNNLLNFASSLGYTSFDYEELQDILLELLRTGKTKKDLMLAILEQKND